MRILKFVKREASGLFRTTLEHATHEQRLGHDVCLKEPNGPVLVGDDAGHFDIETIHSQCDIRSYHNGVPKVLIAHGEPLSSWGNGVSWKAVLDMASLIECIIAMRTQEQILWQSIKKTFVVPKGVDLTQFRPLGQPGEMLPGEPAVLIYENSRGNRNVLYPIVAMLHLWRRFPRARLHILNVTDKKTYDTLSTFVHYSKLWPFVRTIHGPVAHDEVNSWLNRCHIVISSLYPLYARSIEAFGAGKPLICPGYREHNYPYQCELQPESMADALARCWENYDQHDWRAYAEKHHNALESSRQMVAIYERYAV